MVRREWLAERPPTVPAPPSRDGLADAERAPQAGALPAGALRALDAIAQASSPLQITPSLISADPSELAVRLTDGEGAALTLFIERARAGGRYYERGARLGLWYAREREPAGDTPSWAVPILKTVAARLLSPAFDDLADELPERRAEPAREAGTPSGTPEPAPPPQENRPYARLSVLGARDVERFFHVDYEFDEGADVDQPPTARIGIIYQCNQPCTFCQLAEMNTHIPPARVYGALDASRSRGARRVILTGGEPTLCKHLTDYITYARQKGFTTIELQTNAVLIDDPEVAVRLREAGLTDAQVSLHGPDGEISDRLTAAPGTHRRTLDGIANLLDTGVRVLLNHLVFRDNCHLLLDFVDLVERRYGRHKERVILQFHSPLDEFSRPEHARKHIARYSEYALLLRRAIDRGRALGYAVKDLQDPTGIPALCLLDADPDYLGPIRSQRHKPRLHRWESEWMTRVEACRSCDVADACMGIPRAYVALHGEDEFRPVRLTGTPR